MRMMRLWGGAVMAWAVVTTAAAAPQLPFAVATATMQPVAREEVVDGAIEAVQQATISAQTSGRVVAVNFDVDDYVTKGDVLIRFRDTEQRAALKSAQARFNEAEATFNRTKDIYQKKLVARSVYDQAQANYKAARAALEQAQEELDNTVVRAPYSGIVVKRQIEVGELATPGRPLMTGISLEQLRVVADVPQMYINTLREHAKARVILSDGGASTSVEGTKLTISPYADSASHTFKVRVELPSGQHGVYPGMFAKVAFDIGEEQRLLVPTAAVVHRSEVTAVYVVQDDGSVVMRYIRVGRTLPDGSIEVLAGLSAGEKVALDPIRAGIYLKNPHEGGGA